MISKAGEAPGKARCFGLDLSAQIWRAFSRGAYTASCCKEMRRLLVLHEIIHIKSHTLEFLYGRARVIDPLGRVSGARCTRGCLRLGLVGEQCVAFKGICQRAAARVLLDRF